MSGLRSLSWSRRPVDHASPLAVSPPPSGACSTNSRTRSAYRPRSRDDLRLGLRSTGLVGLREPPSHLWTPRQKVRDLLSEDLVGAGLQRLPQQGGEHSAEGLLHNNLTPSVGLRVSALCPERVVLAACRALFRRRSFHAPSTRSRSCGVAFVLSTSTSPSRATWYDASASRTRGGNVMRCRRLIAEQSLHEGRRASPRRGPPRRTSSGGPLRAVACTPSALAASPSR